MTHGLKRLLLQMTSYTALSLFFTSAFSSALSTPLNKGNLTPALCCPRIFSSLIFASLPFSSVFFYPVYQLNSWTSGCLYPALLFSFSCTCPNGELDTNPQLPNTSCSLSWPRFHFCGSVVHVVQHPIELINPLSSFLRIENN